MLEEGKEFEEGTRMSNASKKKENEALQEYLEALDRYNELHDKYFPVRRVIPGEPIAPGEPITAEELRKLEEAEGQVAIALKKLDKLLGL